MLSVTSPTVLQAGSQYPSTGQLVGHRARLQRELGEAFSAPQMSFALIARIVGDLARIDQALAGDRWQRSHERAVNGAASAN